MRLKEALRTSVAVICIAALAAPVGAAPTAPAPSAAQVVAKSPVQVRVAQAKEFSRIEILWPGGAKATSSRSGQTLTLSFGRDANPDISRLRTSPPKWVKGAEAKHAGGRLQLILTLADDAETRVGHADGATYVNVFEKPAEEAKAPAEEAHAETAQAEPQPEPEPERPNPIPAGGVVPMQAKLANGQVQLSFAWANPNGAAVFRRGDAIWVVFDAPATLDVSKAPRGLRQFGEVQAFKGDDYSAIRIARAQATPIFVSSVGPLWTISIGPGGDVSPNLVRIARDEAGGPAALKAVVAGATRVVHVPDPMVGDVMTVVTALGPAKGLPSRREFVQMAFLPSQQGLAVESYVDDLAASRQGDLISLGRPQGLALSPRSAGQDMAAAGDGAPKPAGMPALIDYENWPRTGSGGFLARYHALMGAATDEASKGDEAPVSARMALARFLVGSELSFEAIGVLNDAARAEPKLLDDAEFRGLRGMARVMARRYKEAEADFSAPILAEDPSSALWRSYIAAQSAQWTETRQQFAAGIEAFDHFSPVWKARFARSDAQAAMALGDLDSAEARINMALRDKTDSLEALRTRLVQARIVEAQGHKERALRIYTAISGAPVEQVSAPALLRATQIRMETGKMTPVQAAAVFDGLRYRWRGDATELETIRMLGQLYLGQGRYREALEAFRSAGNRLNDLPEAVQLQADLNAAFRALFLDGLADGLEPIQALAMFYDFKELTPLGADGDAMVRKMVRRLVDVDLLDQAAELLNYQVENRLDGVPKAQVATDLAVIYLMDRKPEQAIQAINSSRTTVLPNALNQERRLIEARAWSGVGRYDSALEIIERDPSKDAEDLRAEVTWKQKNWPAAGALLEKSLGARWKQPGPLSGDEEGKLLRAGVAYSLAGDETALARLDQQYAHFYEEARNPEALRVALSGASSGRLGVSDFGRTTADNEAFAGWVVKMKQRFREKPKAAPPTKQAAAAAPPAAPKKG